MFTWTEVCALTFGSESLVWGPLPTNHPDFDLVSFAEKNITFIYQLNWIRGKCDSLMAFNGHQPSTGFVTMPVTPPTTPCTDRKVVRGYIGSHLIKTQTNPFHPNLQQPFPSFGQTVWEVFGLSVHLLSAFLLEFFVHSDGCQAFTHWACYLGDHSCSAT